MDGSYRPFSSSLLFSVKEDEYIRLADTRPQTTEVWGHNKEENGVLQNTNSARGMGVPGFTDPAESGQSEAKVPLCPAPGSQCCAAVWDGPLRVSLCGVCVMRCLCECAPCACL